MTEPVFNFSWVITISDDFDVFFIIDGMKVGSVDE